MKNAMIVVSLLAFSSVSAMANTVISRAVIALPGRSVISQSTIRPTTSAPTISIPTTSANNLNQPTLTNRPARPVQLWMQAEISNPVGEAATICHQNLQRICASGVVGASLVGSIQDSFSINYVTRGGADASLLDDSCSGTCQMRNNQTGTATNYSQQNGAAIPINYQALENKCRIGLQTQCNAQKGILSAAKDNFSYRGYQTVQDSCSATCTIR